MKFKHKSPIDLFIQVCFIWAVTGLVFVSLGGFLTIGYMIAKGIFG